MKKRMSSGLLALIMVMLLVFPVIPVYAEATGDPLQDNEKIVDIYINADSDSGIDPDLIKEMLMEKLEGATKNYDGNLGILEAADIRINTNMISLDISDLSAWYVYDHYGSNTGAVYENANQTGIVAPPTTWTDVFGASTVKRPYFAYNEVNTYYNPTIYSIEDYLQMSTDVQRYVAPLDQHIFALQDSNGDYAMTFVGYGVPAYADFLFYPATSSGTKEVSFTVDSNYVNTHTMGSTNGGAGFLLNSGIDASGYIHGYVLLYQFNDPNSLNKIALYKINDNVLVDDFHQNGMFSPYVTEVASQSVSSWNPMMDISLEISPTNVTVQQKASSDTTFTEVMNETMEESTYNGFGPLVQYSSHGCDDSTQFRFTKLEMGFATSSSSVLDALAKSNFLDDSEKYFVNLLNEDGSASLNEGDWEGVARMREGEIRYVTNVENPFLNDGGIVSSGAPNGSNGKTILTYADLDELTDKLVAYILGNHPYTTPSGAITLTNPVAIFDLRAGDDESVATIVNNFLPSEGIDIYTNDDSIPSDGAEITTYRYKITDPSGTSQTLMDRSAPASAANPLMTVDELTELGLWTVDLVVLDDESNISATTTVTFQVAEAEEFKVEIEPGAHMTFSGGNSAQTVVEYTDMDDIFVTADEGYAVPGSYYIGSGIVYEKLSDTTGVVYGSPSKDVTATLNACRMASVATCELGKGDESTPDTEKYYITLTPTDPGFEYNIMDEDGNVYPEGQAWMTGTGEAMVFGPFDQPGTYYAVVRPLDSQEPADVIDAFVIHGVDDPGEEPVLDPEITDTGDDSQNGLWLSAAVLAILGMGIAVVRRKISE